MAIRVSELQANYTTIDPVTGKVGANFTGLVNAQGVILPAGQTAGTPVGTNEVVWERQSDGSVIAESYGDRGGAVSDHYIDVHGLSAGDQVINRIRVKDSAGNLQGLLSVEQEGNGLVQILALAQAIQKTVIDSSGNSDFVQLSKGGGTQTLDTNLVLNGAVMTAARYFGTNSSSGVTLTDNNGHQITLTWTGAALQFAVDGTNVHCA